MWPDVPNLARFLLTFKGEIAGQTILNTFPLQVTAVASGEAPLDVLTQAFFASLQYIELEADYLVCLPEDYHLSESWFQQLTPTRARKGVLERDLNGGIEAPGNMANIAAFISRHGSGGTRHDNGGVHLVAPSGVTYISGGVLTAPYKAILQGLADSMIESFTVTTVPGNVYTFQPTMFFKINEPPFLGSTPIVASNVQDTSRVMRRRTVGLGI